MPGDRIRTFFDLEGSRGVSIPDYGEQERLRREELALRRSSIRAEAEQQRATVMAAQHAQAAGLSQQGELARMRESGINRRTADQNRRLTDTAALQRGFEASESQLRRDADERRSVASGARADQSYARRRADTLSDYERDLTGATTALEERRGYAEREAEAERGRTRTKERGAQQERDRLERKAEGRYYEEQHYDRLVDMAGRGDKRADREIRAREASGRTTGRRAASSDKALDRERENINTIWRDHVTRRKGMGEFVSEAEIAAHEQALEDIETRRAGRGWAPSGPRGVEGTGGGRRPRGELEDRYRGEYAPDRPVPRAGMGDYPSGGGGGGSFADDYVRKRLGLGGGAPPGGALPGGAQRPGNTDMTQEQQDRLRLEFAARGGRPTQSQEEEDRLYRETALRLDAETGAVDPMRRRQAPTDAPPRLGLYDEAPGSGMGMGIRGRLEPPIPSLEELLAERAAAEPPPPARPPVPSEPQGPAREIDVESLRRAMDPRNQIDREDLARVLAESDRAAAVAAEDEALRRRVAEQREAGPPETPEQQFERERAESLSAGAASARAEALWIIYSLQQGFSGPGIDESRISDLLRKAAGDRGRPQAGLPSGSVDPIEAIRQELIEEARSGAAAGRPPRRPEGVR